MTTSTTLTNLDIFLQTSAATNKLLPDLITNLGATTPVPPTIATLQDAQTDLNTLTDQMQSIRDDLQAMLDALNPANQNSLADWRNALTSFGVTLSVDSSLNFNMEWGKGGGERAREACTAVQKIISAIARTLAGGSSQITDEHRLNAILQFGDTFNNVQLNIIPGHDSIAETYAKTKDGNEVNLWNNPSPLLAVDESRGYPLWTAENLTHEFGHVLQFRAGSNLYTQWTSMRREFGRFINCGVDQNGNPDNRPSLLRGFDIGDGWNIDLRQNRTPLSGFSDCYKPQNDQELCDDSTQLKKDELCQALEVERLADMFLFWVFADDPDYAFSSDDRGQALSAFSNGGSWSRGSTSLVATGFLGWIEQVSG